MGRKAKRNRPNSRNFARNPETYADFYGKEQTPANDRRARSVNRREQENKFLMTEITPRTENQAVYGEMIASERIVFGLGSSGTGKTWYATALAALAYKRGEIDKIVVTRPAVEAGEKLGFMPGDMDEKFANFTEAVLDALRQVLGEADLKNLIQRKRIVFKPLGFMRGLTFDNSIVIADEMQNATKTQMKLLLTRIGNNTTMIINGDHKQLDIRSNQSGLAHAVRLLGGKEGVGFVTFTPQDIVRDPMCQIVVEAYEEDEEFGAAA